MKKRIAINGFGRIGRMVARALIENPRPDLELVAINDLGSPASLAHLLKYDSVHGRFPRDISASDATINFGLGDVDIVQCKDPENLPWGKYNVDVVFECTGRFTKGESARLHIQAGAKKVLVAAPCQKADHTVVYGVNHKTLKPEHCIISNASCTTNALAPIAYILNKEFGVKHGFMTTIHAYTNDQCLVDSLHSDLRRARAASMSMIPSTTGAAKAVGLVVPELDGKLSGTSIRVPTANVSAVDLKVVLNKSVTIEAVNDALCEASNSSSLQGILNVTTDPVVSIDLNHSTASSTVDLLETHIVDNHFVRILAWYDNEWGFTNRLCDVAQYCL